MCRLYISARQFTALPCSVRIMEVSIHWNGLLDWTGLLDSPKMV